MRRSNRPMLTGQEKADLWRRWQSGESVADICRALNKYEGSIHRVLAARGGIVPATRRRSPMSLSLSEREHISRGIAANSSIRQIASHIGRAPSTVCREIARHGGRARYRASEADLQAWDSARRPKPCRLASRPRLRWEVARKLRRNWSPEQISGWLKGEYPDDEDMHVSHEAIYQSLFIQARGVLKKELMGHLREVRTMRRSRDRGAYVENRGKIVDAVSIRERPAEVEDRAVPGHWEGDLLSGSKNTHIATLVERQTRFTMLVKVRGRDTQSVVSAISRQVRKLPAELRRSLTWDRGKEMTDHKQFTIATDLKVYFCDPQSPWQRGTNENTNRLLRQYFPKGTELSSHTQAHLNRIALELNQRPRKTLGFKAPADKLNEVLL
ncbi:MAG TPA: IS30 family transposase [Usitatibacteraceae bacterium]|nr:IS30 family transposase [Usitatibacteraceae bacterium]